MTDRTDTTIPPHRSHLCLACGATWRPADVPTNGVLAAQTIGSGDTWTWREIKSQEQTL